jgi:CheY-specific phosphatase CheX
MFENLQTLLEQSVEDVLEKMFFIRSLGEGLDAAHPTSDAVTVLVDFDGAATGSLLLRVTRDAARSISADFLGTEDNELTGQQVGEVICELGNMICGSVVSRVDSSGAFRISPPRQIADDQFRAKAAERHCDTAWHSMEVAGGTLTISMNTETLICSTAEKHVS